jgi:hypothetical protein
VDCVASWAYERLAAAHESDSPDDPLATALAAYARGAQAPQGDWNTTMSGDAARTKSGVLISDSARAVAGPRVFRQVIPQEPHKSCLQAYRCPRG